MEAHTPQQPKSIQPNGNVYERMFGWVCVRVVCASDKKRKGTKTKNSSLCPLSFLLGENIALEHKTGALKTLEERFFRTKCFHCITWEMVGNCNSGNLYVFTPLKIFGLHDNFPTALRFEEEPQFLF